MDVRLDGRVIVVTGAASGIGAAIAALAHAAGAALVLTDRNAAGLQAMAATLQGPVAWLAADLADPGAPQAIIDVALARFGHLDGLVNAAALTTRSAMTDGTAEVWDQLFAVNTRAPFFLMQGAINHLRGRGAPGSIVNILSVNATCGQPDLAIYSATKGALLTLTRNAAHAHLAERIRVNGINLGWAETPSEHHMQTQILGQGKDWVARAAAGLPLGRLLQPDEAARLAVYLLADAAAPLTGAVIDLDQRVPGAPP